MFVCFVAVYRERDKPRAESVANTFAIIRSGRLAASTGYAPTSCHTKCRMLDEINVDRGTGEDCCGHDGDELSECEHALFLLGPNWN